MARAIMDSFRAWRSSSDDLCYTDLCVDAISSACAAGQLSMTELIRPYMDDYTFHAIIPKFTEIAAHHGHLEVIQWLLAQSRTSPHTPYLNEAFRRAAACGYSDIVAAFLDYGIWTDAEDKISRNALCLAIQKGHVGVARLLVGRGLRVINLREGDSMEMAFRNGHFKALEYLKGLFETGVVTFYRVGWEIPIENGADSFFDTIMKPCGP